MSSPSSRRSPLWFCYECHSEMRPLMIPDPHCASCNGTFLEEMSNTGEDDYRQIAAENEQSEALISLLSGIGLNSARNASDPLRNRSSSPRGAALPFPVASNGMRSTSPRARGFRHVGGNGSFDVWIGGGSPSGGDALPPVIPPFPNFLNMQPPRPLRAMEDEIETPFGPETRRRPQTAEIDDPRTFLMHYLMGLLSGDPTMMFDGHNGPLQGSGAFGDYVFSQDGLDRIVSQLMEAASSQNKPNPASDDVINTLKKTVLTYDCDLVKSGQSCAICTEYFAPPDADASSGPRSAPSPDENSGPSSGVALTLPCGHPFHDDCITTWLKSNGTCPVCRYALVEQPNAPVGTQTQVPGAATTSTNPPLTAAVSNPARPQPERSSTARSNVSTESSPEAQAQADAVFGATGGPNGLLESLLGLVGRGRPRDGRGEPSFSQSGSRNTTNDDSTTDQAAGDRSGDQANPPIFFRDRPSGSNIFGDNRRQANNNNNRNETDARSPESRGGVHPGAWNDVD